MNGQRVGENWNFMDGIVDRESVGATVYRAGNACRGDTGMWVILLEAGVALALLLIIVWATWPKRRNTRDDDGNEKD